MIKQCPQCRREYETTNTLCPVDGSVLERIGDALEGQVLADKYRIEERLSAGGMGAVYRATHVLMDKKVAVKVLHPALASDEQIVQRFTREARAASRISHPHALNVTDFGEAEGGVVFLVMEYLRGRTLKELIREEGRLPLERAVEIMRQVTGALDAAHAEGVVHRDLKSDNIMLEEVGGHQDWAKVLDFGIAKIQEPIGQDPALTAPNLVIGTPQYMSPEQCSQSSNIDKRSDIYSLGVILFEMLAGHVPFTGESPTAIMMKQLQDEPPSVRDAAPDLPAAIDDVVKRALAKQPEDRYASAGEFAEALATAAEGADAAADVSANKVAATATDAVIASTAANAAVPNTVRMSAVEAVDEATMVSAPRASLETAPAAPRSDSAFNPWRVLIPAALALIAVIGLAYAFTGRSDSESDDAPDVLRADPNSQPVRATVPTATGESERGVMPSNQPTAGASSNSGSSSASSAPSATTDAAPMVSDDPLLTPTDANTNTEREPGNTTADEDANAEPTPATETNRNTNQRRPPVLNPPAPSPTNAPANIGAPPPPPSPRATPSPSPRRRAPEVTSPQPPAPAPPVSANPSAP